MITLQLKNGGMNPQSFEILRNAAARHWRNKGLHSRDDAGDYTVTVAVDDGLKNDRYRIAGEGSRFTVTAANACAVHAGLGRLLLESTFDGRGGYCPPENLPIDFTPEKPLRGTYFATHFYNFYHAAPMEEVCQVIEDLALRGCNNLLVWFDMHHYPSVKDPGAKQLIARLRQILKYANAIGMGGALTMLSNEAFSSSPEALRAEWQAQNGYHHSPDGHYHVEICPSKPGGIEKILEYRRQVLEQFKDLKIDYVVYWPYDQGGCTCKECTPWGANGFLKLLPHYQRLIKEMMPQTKIILSTWYFDKFIDGEWDAFYPRMTDGTLKDVACIMAFFFHGKLPRCIEEKGIPNGIRFVDFPEISMYSCVPWGGYGASHLAGFLNETNANSAHLYSGGFPYSEGVFEDANKFIQLAAYSGLYPNALDALRAYVKYEFCCGDEELYQAILKTETALARRHDFKSEPFRAEIKNTDTVDSVLETMEKYRKRLPETVTRSRTFRLWYLRAVIDGELKDNDGYPLRSQRCQEALQELMTLYHATPETRRNICPPFGK